MFSLIRFADATMTEMRIQRVVVELQRLATTSKGLTEEIADNADDVIDNCNNNNNNRDKCTRYTVNCG